MRVGVNLIKLIDQVLCRMSVPRLPLLTINLVPPVSGVVGVLNVFYDGVYTPVIALPPSVDGQVSVLAETAAPELSYAVIFPSFVYEGVRYKGGETELFDLLNENILSVTFEAMEPTSPPVISNYVAPVLTGLVVVWFLSR